MLSRSQRMTTKMVEDVMKKGRASHSALFVVRSLVEPASEKRVPGCRISAIAPVKIAKTSAGRHLLRRRMYEAARPLIPKLKPGSLILIFAKAPATAASFADLKRAVEEIFVKAGLLR